MIPARFRSDATTRRSSAVSQSQKAGAGAHQIQIMGDYVVQQGVTEERAAEIAREQAQQVIADYSRESGVKAAARITMLDERVVKLLSDEGKLDALQDPAYQIVLRKAQVGAASTDREGDYDLLARLLGQRAGQESKYVQASVDRAVQVVDMIDDAALEGLNVLWVVLMFTPGGNSLAEGVANLEALLQKFYKGNLPLGRRWLDHLDMIDLVRLTSGGITSLKKFVELYAARWPGYLSVGIDAATVAEIKAACHERNVPELQILEHELKPGYYRLSFASIENLENALKQIAISKEDAEFLVALARDKGNLEARDEALVPRLEEAISASPTLAEVRTWWDQISDFPTITSAGVAVAYANSRRYHDFSGVYGLEEYLEQST